MNNQTPRHRNKQILVLFDKAEDFALVKSILANPFFVYFTARSVLEAVKILAKEHIDMVIAGVHLEKTNSYDFLKCLQSDGHWQAIPFVFICLRRSPTARHVNNELALAAHVLGAADYLAIDQHSPYEIRAAIARLLVAAPERGNSALWLPDKIRKPQAQERKTSGP